MAEDGAPIAMEDEEERAPVSLPIFSILKSSHLANGLRNNDYNRYRQYCTRRLRRIRKAVKLLHGRRGFTKRVLRAKDVRDERYLLLPLIQAERAWSYAMQLKHEVQDERARSRFHLIRRLAKAAYWSNQLNELCSERGDPRTALEAEAYSAWMNGNLLLERESWKNSLSKFTQARKVFEKLSHIGNVEENAICMERLESLEPSIKYCTYILKTKSGDDVDFQNELLQDREGMDDILLSKVQAVLAAQRSKEAQSLDTIQWRGETVPIRSEKVRLSLLRSRELTRQIDDVKDDEKQLDMFIELFSAYDDALVVVRDDLQNEKQQRDHTAQPGAREKSLSLLRDFLAFHKLRHTIRRDRLLTKSFVSQLKEQAEGQSPQNGKKPVRSSDVVFMYEKLIGSYDHLGKLGDVDANKELNSEIELAQAYLRAFRCYWVATSWADSSKWVEAVCMFRRCVERCLLASNIHKTADDSESVAKLEALSTEASTQRVFAHARGLLSLEKDAQAPAQDNSKKATQNPLIAPPTLLERLEKFDAGSSTSHHTLVHFPPRFKPVPTKPIFYDLAENFIEFHDMSSRATPPKKSGGLFSSFGWS